MREILTKISILCLLGGLAAVAGCSESVSEEDAGSDDGTDAGEVEMDAGNGGTDAGPGVDAGGALDGLVINEIDAGDEWTELYNTGSSPIALGGYRVCDQNDDGSPKVEECGVFPAGFELGAGEYIVIVEGDPAMDGLVTGADCAAGDPCIHTEFGISNGGGDTIFVLGPEGDDTPLITQAYPPEAAADGNTYCRLPDGTGAFSDCMPTPSAANVAP
ncbi:MAG TPA: lamin tail domain-containing protein [Sandaracinaceae bacterium LLY-WYZ-13_1]|nr:lamin tail domain-containing protein [Sandaracinaceae bacterium LLY-WYZ-13_1]